MVKNLLSIDIDWVGSPRDAKDLLENLVPIIKKNKFKKIVVAQSHREINKIAQEGARNHGLLNVSVTEFFNDIEVPVPSRAEQRKIADFLCVLDKKLNSVKEQIELTQTFKTGLLQQMFV